MAFGTQPLIIVNTDQAGSTGAKGTSKSNARTIQMHFSWKAVIEKREINEGAVQKISVMLQKITGGTVTLLLLRGGGGWGISSPKPKVKVKLKSGDFLICFKMRRIIC